MVEEFWGKPLGSHTAFQTLQFWRTWLANPDLSRQQIVIREIQSHVYPNGKREFVPPDQVFPQLSFTVVSRLSFIHKNCSGQFLSAYVLFWEILSLNLIFAVCCN